MNNIVDTKNYKQKILEGAYRTLWHKESSLAFKLEALDLIARFIDDEDVKARLEYFIEKESSPLLESTMQEILDGNYEIIDEEDIYSDKTSNQISDKNNLKLLSKFLNSFSNK